MPDRTGLSFDHGIAFGPFRLFPAKQLLLEGDKRLQLGSRALAILTILVERAGVLISKEELVAHVWPNIFVEEGNLRVHIAALRRALGDGRGGNRYVTTIPGRGYRFVAPVTVSDRQEAAAQLGTARESASNLPAPLTRMIGRADIVAALVTQFPERRFITISGPGGIGKTTVALAVAEELRATCRDGVGFVDLAPVADPQLVLSALASVLGVAIRSESPLPGLIAFLRDKEMLLVLDSCERVVGAAAALAEEIYKRAPDVRILATSREPLRAEGERVQRLLPLAVPDPSSRLTASEALTFPAIQLFVERAAAISDDFKFGDAEAPLVADICRRLDGMALAIELAAGSVDTFGVVGLAAHLNDRFRLLTRGRRTALPRHQTLSATLDWSYELLTESERTVLCRLAVFAGRFTLEAINTVTSDSDVPASVVVDRVANLIAKSLVAADVGGRTVHYRLLDTTRAYALEKLTEAGDLQLFSRRHAEYFRDLFIRAELEWNKLPRAEWLEGYGGHIDNVRAALDWAFSPRGDAEIGIALTIAAVPLWLQLSLMNECLGRVEQALVVAKSAATPDQRRDMQLSASLGSVRVYTSLGPDARAAWTNALDIAVRLGDIDFQQRSLWGLWVDSLNNGGFQEALSLARQFYSIAAGATHPIDQLMGDRMIGIALHFLGDQVDARQHIERMLSGYVTPIHASHIIRFQFDQRVTAQAFHARILWLLGYPEQAMRTVDTMIDQAISVGHVLSLCNALGQGACLVSLLSGDLAAADRYGSMLLDYATKHDLGLWETWAKCFLGVLANKRHDMSAELEGLRRLLNEGSPVRSLPRYLMLIGELADAMGRLGEVRPALEAIDGAIQRAERNQERWCLAELLRIKGELILREGASNAVASVEAIFRSSIDLARRQAARSWELRTATSLARLHRDQGNLATARELLVSVYRGFTEGFKSADLVAAKHLLDELG